MLRAFGICVGLLMATAAFAAGGDLSRAIGKALFERAWVPAPSSTLANDGLGPVFNARACSSCHVKLGRASSQTDETGGFVRQGMVARLSDAQGRPDARYGVQLQTAAVPGFLPEGRLVAKAGAIEIRDLSDGPLEDGTRIGLRAAPAVRGLGLLEAVPDEVILAYADPDDSNSDGIRGRANWVVDENGERRIGRFGLKASNASLREQVELAFSLDLGMSTNGHRALAGDCFSRACLAGPHGGTLDAPEIRADLVDMMTDYLASVGAPRAPEPDDEGARLFAETGCASCHVPALASAIGEVRAYSDLLLHDLGSDLDGGATEPGVLASEWRTAPLWGVSQAVKNRTGLLHDGRAQSIAEAVGFHGGEASGARTRFGLLSGKDRARLIRFVEGL